jgi:hypothetical protein
MSGPGQAPNVPAGIRPVFDEIIAVTDTFCLQHFDAEYAALCVKLAAKLARKRPSPLAAVTAGSGRPASCTRSGGSTSSPTRATSTICAPMSSPNCSASSRRRWPTRAGPSWTRSASVRWTRVQPPRHARQQPDGVAAAGGRPARRCASAAGGAAGAGVATRPDPVRARPGHRRTRRQADHAPTAPALFGSVRFDHGLLDAVDGEGVGAVV